MDLKIWAILSLISEFCICNLAAKSKSRRAFLALKCQDAHESCRYLGIWECFFFVCFLHNTVVQPDQYLYQHQQQLRWCQDNPVLWMKPPLGREYPFQGGNAAGVASPLCILAWEPTNAALLTLKIRRHGCCPWNGCFEVVEGIQPRSHMDGACNIG